MTEREKIEHLATLLRGAAGRVHELSHQRKHTFANCQHHWCETVRGALRDAEQD